MAAMAVESNSNAYSARNFLDAQGKIFEKDAQLLFLENQRQVTQFIETVASSQYPIIRFSIYDKPVQVLEKTVELFRKHFSNKPEVEFQAYNQMGGQIVDSTILSNNPCTKFVHFTNARAKALNSQPFEQHLSELERRITESTEDCSTPFFKIWKLDVSNLSTHSLNKIILTLRTKKFAVNLDDLIGVASLGHSTCSVRQELVVEIPSIVDPVADDASVSPGSLIEKRKRAETQPCVKKDWHPSTLDQKMEEIFKALRLIATQCLTVRHWKFNVYDLTKEDCYSIQCRLHALGYRTLRGYDYYYSYERAPTNNDCFKNGAWVRSEDLIIYTPRCQDDLSSLHMSYEPSQLTTNFSAFQDLLDRAPICKHLTSDQKASLYWGYRKHPEVETFKKIISSSEGIRLLAADTARYEKNVYHAFNALLDGAISESQFASFSLLYSAIDQILQHPIIYRKITFKIPNQDKLSISYLADNLQPPHLQQWPSSLIDAMNPRAYHLFDDASDFIDLILEKSFALMTAGKIDFKIMLKTAPLSEQFLYTIPLGINSVQNWSPLFHRLHEIYPSFFKPVSEALKDSSSQTTQEVLVIPSFTMIMALIQLAYGIHAMPCRPILGDLTEQQIEAFKETGVRPIQVSMPGIHPPAIADGLATGGPYIFSMHDVYHCFRDSSVTLKERHALKRINCLLKRAIVYNSTDEALKTIQWKLIDGELHFSQEKNRNERFGNLFHLSIWPNSVTQRVIRDMAKNQEVWRGNYGITHLDLLLPEQEMHMKIAEESDEKSAS